MAKAKLARGEPIVTERETVGEFLTHWLADVARHRLAPSSYESYRHILETHVIFEIGHIRLARLTPLDVQRLLNWKLDSGPSPRTVVYHRDVLRAALNDAMAWGLVTRNAAALADPPRQARRAWRCSITAASVVQELAGRGAASAERALAAGPHETGSGRPGDRVDGTPVPPPHPRHGVRRRRPVAPGPPDPSPSRLAAGRLRRAARPGVGFTRLLAGAVPGCSGFPGVTVRGRLRAWGRPRVVCRDGISLHSAPRNGEGEPRRRASHGGHTRVPRGRKMSAHSCGRPPLQAEAPALGELRGGQAQPRGQ